MATPNKTPLLRRLVRLGTGPLSLFRILGRFLEALIKLINTLKWILIVGGTIFVGTHVSKGNLTVEDLEDTPFSLVAHLCVIEEKERGKLIQPFLDTYIAFCMGGDSQLQSEESEDIMVDVPQLQSENKTKLTDSGCGELSVIKIMASSVKVRLGPDLIYGQTGALLSGELVCLIEGEVDGDKWGWVLVRKLADEKYHSKQFIWNEGWVSYSIYAGKPTLCKIDQRSGECQGVDKVVAGP